jgi:hypothetical protein
VDAASPAMDPGSTNPQIRMVLCNVQIPQTNPTSMIVRFGLFPTLATSVDMFAVFQPQFDPSFSISFPFRNRIALQPNERIDTIGKGHPLASWLRIVGSTILYQELRMPFYFSISNSFLHYFQ